MRYYLGIDGGGSKTTAALCDEHGAVLASFVGKGVNYHAIGMEAARRNLGEIMENLFRQAGAVPLQSVFIGHSALSDRASPAQVAAFCTGIVPCVNITMDSDVFIGLAAMETEGSAALVISGTGSMAAGRTADGAILHTGGWGYLLGDEGSGFRMALDALRAAVRGAEGSGEKTLLTEALFSHFHIKDLDAVIARFYDPAPARSEIAAFAPTLFACANAGDAAALLIIKKHAALLADTAAALLRQLPAGTPLGLWGGVFEHASLFRDLFAGNLLCRFPQTKAALLKKPPVCGALALAMRENAAGDH